MHLARKTILTASRNAPCAENNFAPLAQKIITLREKLRGFKDPQALTQLPEITTLEWEEWKEEGIIINTE
jgi:hypothetical protein